MLLHNCLLTLAILFSFVNLIVASGFGNCPKHATMKDFNHTRFTGRWYEVERSFYLMELASGCTTIDIEANDKGQLEVTTNLINRWTGNHMTPSKGIATPSKRDSTIFKYQVQTRLPSALARLMPGAGTYQVLKTDYDNYAIIWTCSSMGIAHQDQIWVLGRNRDINADQRVEIYGSLAELHIDSDRLILSKNKNCTD